MLTEAPALWLIEEAKPFGVRAVKDQAYYRHVLSATGRAVSRSEICSAHPAESLGTPAFASSLMTAATESCKGTNYTAWAPKERADGGSRKNQQEDKSSKCKTGAAQGPGGLVWGNKPAGLEPYTKGGSPALQTLLVLGADSSPLRSLTSKSENSSTGSSYRDWKRQKTLT